MDTWSIISDESRLSLLTSLAEKILQVLPANIERKLNQNQYTVRRALPRGAFEGIQTFDT